MGINNEIEISKPQAAILSSRKQVNLFLGGVGSGKTHLGAFISYIFIKYFPSVYGFIGANFYDQLNTSTLFRIRSVWRDMGLIEYSKDTPDGVYVVGNKPPSHFNTKEHAFERYSNIISFIGGTVIFIGSLDNAKAHDGKQFGWAILDETKDTKEEDVKDIIMARLRQKGIYVKDGEFTNDPTGEPFNPLYILTSPAKVSWINEWFELENDIAEIQALIYSDKTYFRKEFNNKYVTISSTYHNLPNLPSNYIENYKQNNSEERVKALIYANPFATQGGEFYSSFSRLTHVINDPKYKPSLAIHVSFDQNVVPYNSATVWQLEKVKDKWMVLCIGEVTLENPNNSTEEVCVEVLRRFGDAEGLFYYGDSSGSSRNVVSKEYRHHYQVIEKMFRKKLNNNSNRVLRRNPLLIKRREFVNKIFEGKLPIDMLIGNNCPKLMADLTYIKQDIDGTKKKEVVTNKDTGERYQKWGHLSDTMDYFLCAAFNTYFND
jgi:hypothetical protein